MSAPRLLFVDDDASVSHVLSIWLRRWGYDVITAGSGQEAERLLDERFDALVLDLRLPGMRGDAFYYLATVRQPWLTPRALFLTGEITEQAEVIVGATGCQLLRKPFPMHELLDAITAMAPLPASEVPRVS